MPSSKASVANHLPATLSSSNTVDEVFDQTHLSHGLACADLWILRYFPTVAPFLLGNDTSTQCETREKYARSMEV